ncbi:cell division protein ZapE [Paraburkholderia sp. J12]|uniref:cell division protein ZapE n=1 Tax=Paraburkholderia sp. J12 TaxID=2805432 RepID=UPI002ABE8BC3|nr:cell division protein ZapE [Paraburkholderia sp. J12]
MDVTENFRKLSRARSLIPDASQMAALGCLQRSYDGWHAYEADIANPLRRLIKHPEPPKGIYLWGSVGRGKTLLMDCFYAVVPVRKKTRLHFHEFMHDVHLSLEDLRGQPDPLDSLGWHLSSLYHLICLDEFHVTDIADAMILHRLLYTLFDNRVQIVATSNYFPDDLYPDGLNRDRFLPAIALIKDKLETVEVDAGVDYRERAMAGMTTYHFPASSETQTALKVAFEALAEGSDENPVLSIERRQVRARRRAGGIVWFDFGTLCGSPRSQNDYLVLAARFKAVILSEVPQMTAQAEAAARRFTWLVDVLYDHNVKLILSAAVAPDELYPGGPLAGEFARTVSRLKEMQSVLYLQSARRPVAKAWTQEPGSPCDDTVRSV